MTDDHLTKRKENKEKNRKRLTDDIDEIQAAVKRLRSSILGGNRHENLTEDIIPVAETTIEELTRIHDDQIVELNKNMRKEFYRTKRRWSELPTDLLELILRKLIPSEFDILRFTDILRFKAVCHSWRTAAKSCNSYAPLPRTPWLLLHSNNISSLFDPAENKVYKIRSVYDSFPNARCVGLSHGWMIMFDEKEESMAHLFNPISRASIPIPGFQALPPIYSFLRINYHIPKGIVSSNPSSNKKFYVVVEYEGVLAFCKHEDKSWTLLDDAFVSGDIIFHDEKLFALTTKSLKVWDFRESFPQMVMDIKSNNFSYFLASSAGEILRVRKSDRYMLSKFLVEKLNSIEKKWEKVQSLGDQILFWFHRQVMLLPNPCFLGHEKNSIYFVTSDCITRYGQEIGIFNLEENRVRSIEPVDEHLNKLKHFRSAELFFWMDPSPW